MFAVTSREKKPRIFLYLILVVVGALVMTALSQVSLADESADFSTSVITANRTRTLPDGRLSFRVVVTNIGSDATNVNVSNVLPSNLAYIENTYTAPMVAGVFEDAKSASESEIAWSGDIKSGQSVVLEYDARVIGEPPIDSAIANIVSIEHGETAVDISATTKVVASINHSLFMPVLSRPAVANALTATNPQPSGSAYEWTLSWAKGSEAAGASYLIEESHDPNFVTDVKEYFSNSSSHVVRHPASQSNVFYYRVKAADDAAAVYSNVVEVVSAYRDDFSAESNWEIRREDSDDTDNELVYRDDSLMMWVHGRWDYAIASPLTPAPAPPYRISTRVQFAGPGNLNTYGIVFGTDWNGDACNVEVTAAVSDAKVTPETNCMNAYYRAMMLWSSGGSSMKTSLKRIDGHNSKNAGFGKTVLADWNPVRLPSGSANGWNEWSIEVYPDGEIRYYVGDNLFKTAHDTALIDQPYWGLWASTDEYPGSDPLYDWVLVEPIAE